MHLVHLYVGSVGYEGSGSLATAVATTPEAVEKELDRIEKQEIVDYRNAFCSEDCGEDCSHMSDVEFWRTGPDEEGAMYVFHFVLGVRPSRRFRFLPNFLMDDLRAGEAVLAD